MKIEVKKLNVKKDDRGWLAEILRTEDVKEKKFGQILITVANSGQVKGNHYHKRKKEWYCVLKGKGLLKIWNSKSNQREEFEMGDNNMVLVRIPTGYFHSIENIGKDEMFLLVYLNESFDPNDTDTFYE